MEGTETTLSGERLVELLEQQQALYRQLRILSDRQKVLVVQEDAEPLLTLLAERQRMVDGLVALNGRLAPFRKRWTEFYSGLDETCRKRAAELLEEVNGSLNAILQSDRKDTATLGARRQNVAQEMASLDAGSRAGAAYADAGRRTPSNLTDAKA